MPRRLFSHHLFYFLTNCVTVGRAVFGGHRQCQIIGQPDNECLRNQEKRPDDAQPPLKQILSGFKAFGSAAMEHVHQKSFNGILQMVAQGQAVDAEIPSEGEEPISPGSGAGKTGARPAWPTEAESVSYTHLRAHEA